MHIMYMLTSINRLWSKDNQVVKKRIIQEILLQIIDVYIHTITEINSKWNYQIIIVALFINNDIYICVIFDI